MAILSSQRAYIFEQLRPSEEDPAEEFLFHGTAHQPFAHHPLSNEIERKSPRPSLGESERSPLNPEAVAISVNGFNPTPHGIGFVPEPVPARLLNE